MSRRALILVTIFLPTLALSFLASAGRALNTAPIINVSGTVTGPSGPVANASILVNSFIEVKQTSTSASGFYSLNIEAQDELNIHVRPALAERLTQSNHRVSGISGDVVKHFLVEDGYLLDFQILDSAGLTVTEHLGLELMGLQNQPEMNYWYFTDWDETTFRYQAVLPPDIYYVTVRHTPAGTFDTTEAFDLRTADQVATISLNTTFVHPIPYDPPDASKITIGLPDGLGEASVSGGPGATLPLAQILLVNLDSTHQSDAISDADGTFDARIYAPPGSAIMIKHGPASHRWADLKQGLAEGVNPFPGTIIHAPFAYDDGDPGTLTFATAGPIEGLRDDKGNTRNYVGAAWALTGTLEHRAFDGAWSRVISGAIESELMHGLYLGGLNWTHPALGDLDNDDDLDMLMGERSGTLLLYRNLGDVSAPDWQYEMGDYAGVDTGGWAYPALVDVTGDGVLDLFVGSGDGHVDIYYNQGTITNTLWPNSSDETLNTNPSASPALADLNDDGDLDLVVGTDSGRLTLFSNNGTLAEPDWAFITDTYGTISESVGIQPSFVDLDEDTDLDLLVGRQGDFVWYRNNGPPGNPNWERMQEGYMGIQGSSALSPGLGDWDNDTDLDLVTGEHWGVPRFFRNDGPPTWTEQLFPWAFDFQGDSAPALADWDSDGDADLLVGQVHGSLLAYTNTAATDQPAWEYAFKVLDMPGPNHPHAFPALADLNNDGDADLVIGEGGWPEGTGAGGKLYFAENIGTPTVPDWTDVTPDFANVDVGGWSAPAFADINDDQDLDLFIGDEEGYLTFVENVGDEVTPSWASPEPLVDIDFGSYTAPSFFDLDQDGDLDMLIGLGDGTLTHLKNVGAPNAPEWELAAENYLNINLGRHAMPTPADMNGDHLPDLILGGLDGGLQLYIYDGPGTPEPLDPARFDPGDLLKIEGTIQLHSQAITSSTDISQVQLHGFLMLQRLFNDDGTPLAPHNYFMSTMLTPVGLPIQRAERAEVNTIGQYQIDDFQFAGGNTISGAFTLNTQIPDDLPPGIYRPLLEVSSFGVPTSTQWLAATVMDFTYLLHQAPLAPIQVGESAEPHLIWRLLMDDIVQGTRGTGAREDEALFGQASQIVTQGAAYYVPALDAQTNQTITYRLEPFLPMFSYTDRRLPCQPLLPLDLPGGELCVTVHQPDGASLDLGCDTLAQSFNRTKTTRAGLDLNNGTTQLDDVYSLMVAGDRFRVSFDQYGRHTVEMTGTVEDHWGNSYSGGGTYDVWVANPLDIDPGILPGTPLNVGDAFNPAMQFYPRVPAGVTLTVTHFPNSDPASMQTHTVSGTANDYGYFSTSEPPITLDSPGEFRVDVTALYTDSDGINYMGTLTWASIVSTPDDESQLVAHGRRGLDSLVDIPNSWFRLSNLTIPPDAISHAFNPYYNGDILWSRMSDGAYGGDSLLVVASVQDTVGDIAARMQQRISRMHTPIPPPGDVSERFLNQELPLFSSTRSGQAPQLILGQIGAPIPDDVDQIAYSYRSSQRPGTRVREVVSEDAETGGYWRLDTLYDDQLSVGIQGDQVNDFKFQYVGAVYRDLDSGHSEYLAQGSGWIFIPDDDTAGSRVMPPYAGYGGWTADGGPILTLDGQPIHIFILPTGVRPGAVLEEGDIFHFGGHLMPTLDSQVVVTVTAPSGATSNLSGQANSVGYFYDPSVNFAVNEPGLWTVDVKLWHDGAIGTGESVICATDPSFPCPSGDVLGSDQGRYEFYVAPADSRLQVSMPEPGFLTFNDQVTPITITGPVPDGLSDLSVEYTINMPGYILEKGQALISSGAYTLTYDPLTLNQDFPNLDLVNRDDGRPGLADTISIGLLLKGKMGSEDIHLANTITIQGEQLFVAGSAERPKLNVYIPLVVKE